MIKNLEDIKWSDHCEGDDFDIDAQIEGYHLRIEQMHENAFWFSVYYNGEDLCIEQDKTGNTYTKTLKEAKIMCFDIIIEHKNKKI